MFLNALEDFRGFWNVPESSNGRMGKKIRVAGKKDNYSHFRKINSQVEVEKKKLEISFNSISLKFPYEN